VTSAMVRTVIVEDEPQARRALREYVAETDWLQLDGEAADGREAVALIDRVQPHLVFLDVRLPELSGLEVIQRVRAEPEIVFTTAYNRYAVTAFELGALDYLVKPFGRERFRRTLEVVRRRLALPPGGPLPPERARQALAEAPLARLFARAGDRIHPIPVASIQRIQARGDYAEIHAPGGPFLVHVSLAELAARLDPSRFFQVHRSHIVSLDAVTLMRPYDDRRLVVVLAGGDQIVASRSASEALRKLVR
jgi:two-component system LytT family response regulator